MSENDDDIVVISIRVADRTPEMLEGGIGLCSVCGARTIFAPSSKPLVDNGAKLLCMQCYQDDPPTELATIRQETADELNNLLGMKRTAEEWTKFAEKHLREIRNQSQPPE